MLKLAHQIVCVNMGIAYRTLPAAAATCLPPLTALRRFSSTSQEDVQATMDKINDLFVEARDEIAYAQEDAGTTYFNESYDDAKGLVDSVLREWGELLSKLDDEEKGKVQRSMGLKMEQLKAELEQLNTLHD